MASLAFVELLQVAMLAYNERIMDAFDKGTNGLWIIPSKLSLIIRRNYSVIAKSSLYKFAIYTIVLVSAHLLSAKDQSFDGRFVEREFYL